MTTPARNIFPAMIIFAVLAGIGFVDSAYLTATHYMGEVPTCSIIEGCDVVALSDYADIAGIPVALLGSIFYLSMLVAAFFWFDTRKNFVVSALPYVTVPAFMFSAWLVYAMFFVIEALCSFCLLSAASTTGLMLTALYMKRVSVT